MKRFYSPIRYGGGKTKAIPEILKYLPKDVDKVISVFMGGGSFECYISQKLNIEVIGHDIFSELVNFWNVLLNNNDLLVKELDKLIPDKDNYKKNKMILLTYWNEHNKDNFVNSRLDIQLTDVEKKLLDDDLIKRAAYYYYNHQLSYGPCFLGWASSIYLKDDRYKKIKHNIKEYKNSKLKVYCRDFEETIKMYPNEFLYLDPPYLLNDDEDNTLFIGLYPNRNFAFHHNSFNHIRLCELLKEHKGGFILTYNNCKTIRDMYKDYEQVFPQWNYSFNKSKNKKSNEIFLINRNS